MMVRRRQEVLTRGHVAKRGHYSVALARTHLHLLTGMMAASKDGAPSPPTGVPNLSNAALKSVSSLMGLQVFSRLISFALNQALVRLATPDVYGTVSIQLELLLNTILFLSREGFRNALLRADVDASSHTDTSLLVSNIALLPVYLGIPVSVFTSASYLRLVSMETKSQALFHETVVIYTLAAVLELFSEPMHVK